MQNWEKELKQRRLQEIDFIEKSCEENFYEKENDKNSKFEKKLDSLSIITKAFENNKISEEVFKESLIRLRK